MQEAYDQGPSTMPTNEARIVSGRCHLRERPAGGLPSRVVSLLCSLSILGSTACYTYAPTSLDVLPVDSRVRARLSTAEQDRLQLGELLQREDRVLEGRVTAPDADTLRLLVTVLPAEDWGFRTRELRQQLAIPRNGIVELEIKELDRTKTGLVAAIGSVALAAILANQLFGWFGGEPEVQLPDKEGLEGIVVKRWLPQAVTGGLAPPTQGTRP